MDDVKQRRAAFWRGFWEGLALGIPTFIRAAKETPKMYFAPILWLKRVIFQTR